MATLSKTKYTNLYRYDANGVYFLQCKIQGKSVSRSLQTTDLEEARQRQAELIEQIHKDLEKGNAGKNEALTLNEALDNYQTQIEERGKVYGKSNDGFSPSTVTSYLHSIAKVREYLPKALLNRPMRKVSDDDLRKHMRPMQEKYAATTYNTARTTLIACFEIGVKNSACRTNPAESLPFTNASIKDLSLPTAEQWVALIDYIRAGGATPESLRRREIVRLMIAGYTKNVETDYEAAFNANPGWLQELGLQADFRKDPKWHSILDMRHYIRHQEADTNRRGQESADLVEFLTYCGTRLGETIKLTWDKVDFSRGLMTFTKNTRKRAEITHVIRIHPELVPVLRRCRARSQERGDNKVWGIKACDKAIDNACKALGFPHWCHHDFRHLFATSALEGGATLVEVGALLGHKPGSDATKRYLHASLARAAKIAEQINFRRAAKAKTLAEEIVETEARLAMLKAGQSNVVPLPKAG